MVILWLVQSASDKEVLGLIPTTSDLFYEQPLSSNCPVLVYSDKDFDAIDILDLIRHTALT